MISAYTSLAQSGICASQDMILLNPRLLHHIGINMHGMRIFCIAFFQVWHTCRHDRPEPHRSNWGKYVRRWSMTSHGEFSVTSAWESIWTRLPKHQIFRLIWNGRVTPTISVFLWRLLFGRLPVDEKLQGQGISLASRCYCYRFASAESFSHVFLLN